MFGKKNLVQVNKTLDDFLVLCASAQGFIYNCKILELRKINKYNFDLVNSRYSDFTFLKDESYNLILNDKDKKQKLEWINSVPSQIFRNGVTIWREAMARWKRGLAKQPRYKKKAKKNSVWLTSDQYEISNIKTFEDILGNDWIEEFTVTIKCGNSIKNSTYETFVVKMGKLPIESLPKSLHMTKIREKWFCSFGYEDLLSGEIKTEQELIDYYSSLSITELNNVTIGIDLGVTHILSVNGTFYDLEPKVADRLRRKEIKRKHYQRKLARQTHTILNNGKARKKGEKLIKFVKGEKIEFSKNMVKTKKIISNTYEYQTNCRVDFAHKVSKQIVNTENVAVIAVEDLKIKNMMRRPKPKKVNGSWVRNGAAAKSGLNRAIQNVGWGRIKRFIKYKATKKNILVVEVPAQYTSQRCSPCGHISKDNRRTQADFHCVKCGYIANADHNADANIKYKAINMLVGGGVSVKDRKKLGGKKKNGGVSDYPPNKMTVE